MAENRPAAPAQGGREHQKSGIANRQQKTPPPEGSGVFVFMTSKEEISLSLAGLAVTYSPRA
jgi:hypothetical protein